MSSETSKHRHVLAPWCVGIGLDIGFGGDPIVPTAITLDLPQPYTTVGSAPQILRADCRNLSMFCDSCLDYIYSSHVVEDFSWSEIKATLGEWRRILKPGGRLVLCCPDEREYRAACEQAGQPPNEHHKNADFSLETFFRFLHLACPGRWMPLYSRECAIDYSWHLVLAKCGPP